jgi:uncharacterized Zn-binding protein involved in type VI secretion
MATGVQSIVAGIVDATSTPATAKVPANFRVTASGLPVGVVGDVVSFTGLPTVTGTWITGSMRVTVNGLQVINQSASSVTVLSNGSPGGPMVLQTPDTRVTAG